MSETQRTLFNNRRVSGLLIAGALLLLLIIVGVSFRFPSTPEEVKARPDPEPPRVRLASPPVFDSKTFKRTIIDNNLFCLLGWTPPRFIEPYRLLDTLLSRDGDTPPQTILQMTDG